MTLLLNDRGLPEPSPSVAAQLRKLHDGLSLKFVEGAGAAWAVCLTWPRGDERWQYVQKGDVAEAKAYDIIGYLPMDCPLDSAPSYLTRIFRTYPREDVQRIIESIDRWNAAPAQQAMEQAIAEVLDQRDPSEALPKRRSRK